MDQARIQALRFWEALDAFATSQEPAVARAYVAAVDALRAKLTDAELETLVVTGNVDAILELLDFDAMRFALRDSAIRAATQTPDGFAPPANRPNRNLIGTWPTLVRVRFDTLAPYAVASLRDFESRAIEVLRAEIRAGVIAEIQNGLSRGLNPRETAREIRELIGLPENLARAAERYRQELLSGSPSDLRAVFERTLRDQRFDRTVLRAIEEKVGLDPKLVDRMVARYAQRAIAFNAETISRTATMDALNLGNRMAWQQALDEGKVLVHELRRFWIVAKDERTCPRCLTIPVLNPQGRGMDEPFVTPYDGLVMYPTLHFRCRCIIYTRYDYLS